MPRNYSTFSIARLLGVDPGSVANWIDQGLLKAHRTPGGHRRVAREDLVAFLHRQKMPVPEPLGGRTACVLVVDDQPEITDIVARSIKAAHPDYQVAEAHDGFKAGSLLTTIRPHVVILDLRMPGMDGYEVCRMIKSLSPQPHVIAITAYPSDRCEKKIAACGARVCLSKPLDMNKLLQEVEIALK